MVQKTQNVIAARNDATMHAAQQTNDDRAAQKKKDLEIARTAQQTQQAKPQAAAQNGEINLTV